MTTKMMTGGALLLLFALAACDMGPYDPAAHRRADVATGSHLSGVDTGVDDGAGQDGDGDLVKNPAIQNNFGGPSAGGHH